MAIARYLAMTANEFANAPTIPDRIAWMACHFSPYSTDLLNIPDKIPANSLLILNDSTPPSGHDPQHIAAILEQLLKKENFTGLLLDFQRSGHIESQRIVEKLVQLDVPVCVSDLYARNTQSPVFLQPLPHTVPLSQHIAPWNGREIWLDIALNCEQITVSRAGSKSMPLDTYEPPASSFKDKELHCHYHIEEKNDGYCFTLFRTKEDLEELLDEAENLGIKAAVGLYQELK